MADAPPVKPWGQNDNDLLQTWRRLPGRLGVIVAAPEAQGTSVSINVLPSPSPDWRQRPEKRRSNASRRRGDQGIAATVTAALAKFSCLSKKGARAGAALTASYRRALTPQAGPRWRHGGSRGRRGRDGDGGEENRSEGTLIRSLVGLRRCWTTRMRMTVAAGGTKQKPTP